MIFEYCMLSSFKHYIFGASKSGDFFILTLRSGNIIAYERLVRRNYC